MRMLPKLLLAAAVAALLPCDLPAQRPDPPPTKPRPSHVAAPVKPPRRIAPELPLYPRERAEQLLNRFTFGPRPGELERVLAVGADKWFETQLSPGAIPDPVLDRRLADYPTLTLQPDAALLLFPDRGLIQQVAEGKHPYPADAQLSAVYEVQVYKFNHDRDAKKIDANGQPAIPQPSAAELAEARKADQATASRIAGDLFALPRKERMSALLERPVSDRIAFTTYVAGDQKNLLMAEFSPRERELFQGMAANIGSSYQIISELSQAKLLRAILSERQLQEVMTDFWFNHFNVYIGKDSDLWYTTSYERDAIRKHALGKFRDLLLATATSPAMMVYLDNWQSVGPDSLANGVNPANPKSKRGNKGLNENYGREVMELHTLSVDGGYTQADVTALSSILTGWGVDKPNQGGPFLFDEKRHEPGPKQWLGRTVAQGRNPDGTPAGMREGVEALNVLAASPKTAHFISFLLAQRFVADDPASALVDRLAATYLSTDGDISAILRALVASPEFNARRYFRTEVKTPLEFLASAFRASATDPVNPGALVATLKSMGMPLFYALPPTGYILTADHWLNTGALVDRLNFAYALTAGKFANQKFDSPRLLALGLLAQPAAAAPSATHPAGTTHPAPYTPAVLLAPALRSSPAPGGGPEGALHILSTGLVGEDVSPRSDDLIRHQLEQIPQATPVDTLNLMTALILGSPEFQRR